MRDEGRLRVKIVQVRVGVGVRVGVQDSFTRLGLIL